MGISKGSPVHRRARSRDSRILTSFETVTAISVRRFVLVVGVITARGRGPDCNSEKVNGLRGALSALESS